MKILGDNRYHSPEMSESDEEHQGGKRSINVYNPSWRSDEVRSFYQCFLFTKFQLKFIIYIVVKTFTSSRIGSTLAIDPIGPAIKETEL